MRPRSSDDNGPVPWRRLWAIAHPHRALLLGATASLALVSAGALVVPKLAGDIVDVALDGGTLAGLLRTVGAMILIFVGIGIAAFLEAWMLGIARARIQRDMRRRFFDHLVHLSPSFYDRRQVGELLSRLISDLGAVEGPLTTQIPLGIGALLRFLGTLAVLGWLHPRLTLVALTVVPPIVALSLFVGRRVERVSTGVRDAIARSTALAQESLTGLRTVQASDAIGPLRRRYRGTVDDVYGVQRRSVFLQAIFAGGATFAGFTAFALVLGYGGALILKLELTPGELMTFLLYTFSIALSVGQLGSLYTAWRNLAGASRRMFEILDTASEVADPADGPAGADAFEPSVALGVEVDDVAFAYRSSDARALAGVTLSVTPGSTVAFVGPSGSGKSTLFALLLRFYDPERGALRLDGRDVRTIALVELRRSIGFVPQDVFLLSGTIAENLRLGREGASETELWDALESAGAEAFVRALPQGVDTEVGERGLRLSGGQRQRIAIARAFLEDPALLLLDEATSALDPDSEERIQAALERLFHGRTTLVIAHRLSTARRADVIYVLDAGRIVDCGTHSTLIETSALYRRYWQLQSLDV